MLASIPACSVHHHLFLIRVTGCRSLDWAVNRWEARTHPAQVTSHLRTTQLSLTRLNKNGNLDSPISLMFVENRKSSHAHRKRANSTEVQAQYREAEIGTIIYFISTEIWNSSHVCYLRTAASCNTPSEHSRQPNGEGTCRGLLVFAETTVYFVSICDSGTWRSSAEERTDLVQSAPLVIRVLMSSSWP